MIKETLQKYLEKALANAKAKSLLKLEPHRYDLPISIERPRNKLHGDFASGLALKLACGANIGSMQIAEILQAELREIAAADFVSEISAPGFINFRLKKSLLQAALAAAHSAGANGERLDWGAGKRVLVEYPATRLNQEQSINQFRRNVIGTCLGNLLEFAGYEIERNELCNDKQDKDFRAFALRLPDFDSLIKVSAEDSSAAIKKITDELALQGKDISRLEFLLTKDVNLLCKDKNEVSAKEKLLTNLELEVGRDALNYYLVESQHSSPLLFDPVLSSKIGMENRLFCIQYAYARASSFLKRVKQENLDTWTESDLFEAENPPIFDLQKQLLLRIDSFAELVNEAVGLRFPGRVARFAHELSLDLHRIIETSVISSVDATSCSSLSLIVPARQVLAKAMALISVSLNECI